MGPDTGVAMRSVDEQGIRLWNEGPTDRCNSTRMELMAVAAGFTLPFKIHIKSDNVAVVNKTTDLIETAGRWNRCYSTDYWPGSVPYKRPWELQSDGDLWRLVWQAILQRGTDTVQATRFKGHASDEHVHQGIIPEQDRKGNEEADSPADLGAMMIPQAEREFLSWCARRHVQYVEFMTDVNKGDRSGAQGREAAEAKHVRGDQAGHRQGSHQVRGCHMQTAGK